MPLKSLDCPTGMVQMAGTTRSLAFICSMADLKSAPRRSSLFTYAMRGTLYLLDWNHTVSLWTSTPPTAQNTPMAPSRTRSDRSTSAVKSTWPGVSMMLMVVSPQSIDTAALLIVMPLARSSGSKSVVVSPSSTSPNLCFVPL